MPPPARSAFLSYAHEDDPLFHEFRVHEKALREEFPTLTVHADTDTPVGDRWEEAIMRRIALSDIFILLVSAKFIGSDFIRDQELPAIGARQIVGAAVLPVILRPCAWELRFSAAQVSPTWKGHVRPVSKWPAINDGFDHARRQIAAAVKPLFADGAAA